MSLHAGGNLDLDETFPRLPSITTARCSEQGWIWEASSANSASVQIAKCYKCYESDQVLGVILLRPSSF